MKVKDGWLGRLIDDQNEAYSRIFMEILYIVCEATRSIVVFTVFVFYCNCFTSVLLEYVLVCLQQDSLSFTGHLLFTD